MNIKKYFLIFPLILFSAHLHANFLDKLKGGFTSIGKGVKQTATNVGDATASCLLASCQGFSHGGQKTEHIIVALYARNYSKDNVSIYLQKLGGNVNLKGSGASLLPATLASPTSVTTQYKGGRNMFIARQDVVSYVGKLMVTGQHTFCTADITVKLNTNANGTSRGIGGMYAYIVSHQSGDNCVITKSGEMNHGVTFPGASALIPNVFGGGVPGSSRVTYNLKVPLFVSITPSIVN